MFKNNKKGIIALALVLVLAVAALFVWQAAKPETHQGSKEIVVNVDHLTMRAIPYIQTPNISVRRSSRRT